jgi:hypothetical protein
MADALASQTLLAQPARRGAMRGRRPPALGQLCRYITRPELPNERVQTNDAGHVVLKLKTAWRDSTTHQMAPPLALMQGLAVLMQLLLPRQPRTASRLSVSVIGRPFWVANGHPPPALAAKA